MKIEFWVVRGHFTVIDGKEAGVDLALIQTFLLYYVITLFLC